MMANVDMDLELDSETRKRLIEMYIKRCMCSGSLEVYARGRGSYIKRAGDAMLNEAVTMCLGAAIANDKDLEGLADDKDLGDSVAD